MYRTINPRSRTRRIASIALPVMLTIIVAMMAPGCSRESAMPTLSDHSLVGASAELGTGAFTIESKYTLIRGYNGGGGVFILRLIPGEGFTGDVHLSLSADPKLNAELTRSIVNGQESAAEIAIEPTRSMEPGLYSITLTASNATTEQTIDLQINMQDMAPGNVGTTAESNQARDIFVAWLESEHPELGNLSNRNWFQYMTYGQTLEVEHWTFLDFEWEIRVAMHQTWEPDDWYKFRLRKREAWDGTIALFRESDGTIYEFPVSEYPTIYFY